MDLFPKIQKLTELMRLLDKIDLSALFSECKKYELSLGIYKALEHLELAKYHLKMSLQMLITIDCYEEKGEKKNIK